MSARGQRHARAERGVALVFVLWAGALLSAMAIGMSLNVAAHLATGAGAVDGLQAELLAEAGIRAGVAVIVDRARTREGRTPHRFDLRLGTGSVSVDITSEHGRIDLNEAAEVLVHGLASRVTGGRGGELAAAWLARRAGEAAPAVSARGGEGRLVSGSFTVRRQLLELPGVDGAVYARLAAATTVHSKQAGIDPLTAPRDVLLALPDATPELIDEYIAERSAVAAEGHERRAAELLGRLRARLPRAHTVLVVPRPVVFSIIAVARLENGAESARVATILLERTPGRPYRVLEWSSPGTHAVNRQALADGAGERS